MRREGMLHQIWNEPLGRYKGGRCTFSLDRCESERLSLLLGEECKMVNLNCGTNNDYPCM